MKKLSLILLITFLTSLTSHAQSKTYTITKVQIMDPKTRSWDEYNMSFNKLELTIDQNKNIQFYDYNMNLMVILAGKEYVGQYDNVSFSNDGLDLADANNGSNDVFGYNGKIKLTGHNNFPASADAYASFIYYPGTSNLGMIEIRNKFCMCYLRFTIKSGAPNVASTPPAAPTVVSAPPPAPTVTSTPPANSSSNTRESEILYLLINKDVAKAGLNAWNHYQLYGKKEGRIWPNLTKNNTPVNNKINAQLYLLINKDVAKVGLNAWNHYQTYGKNEGRIWPNLIIVSDNNPTNCGISSAMYLILNNDVAEAGLNAWSHYQSYGKNEGRIWPGCSSTF